MSDVVVENFVSVGCLGAAFGALLSGPLIDKFGRKSIIFSSCTIYFAGGLCLILPIYFNWVLVLGRMLIGFAIGVTSMNVPIYISEICPIELRGRVVAIYQVLTVLGNFLANIFGLAADL